MDRLLASPVSRGAMMNGTLLVGLRLEQEAFMQQVETAVRGRSLRRAG